MEATSPSALKKRRKKRHIFDFSKIKVLPQTAEQCRADSVRGLSASLTHRDNKRACPVKHSVSIRLLESTYLVQMSEPSESRVAAEAKEGEIKIK